MRPVQRSKITVRTKSKGLTLVEVSIAVAVAGLATGWGLWTLSQNMERERARTQGDYLKVLGDAVKGYAEEHFSSIAANTAVAGFANPAQPTVAELRAAGFLDPSFQNAPFYGGSYVLRATRSAGCGLGATNPSCSVTSIAALSQPMTYRGQVAWASIGEAAQRIGGRAGFSSANTPTQLSGLEGAWTSPNPVPTAGILAVRDVYSSASSNTFLRRDGAFPMTGSLQMGGNAVLTQGGAVQTAGGQINTGGGSIVAGAGAISGGAISGSSLSATGSISGSTLSLSGAANTGSLTTNTLSASSASISGGLTTNTLRLAANVSAGGSCTSGSLGVTAAGDLVTCQGGQWRRQRQDLEAGLGSLTTVVTNQGNVLNNHEGRITNNTYVNNAQAGTLNQHGTLLNTHAATLSAYNTRITNNTNTLNNHDNRIYNATDKNIRQDNDIAKLKNDVAGIPVGGGQWCTALLVQQSGGAVELVSTSCASGTYGCRQLPPGYSVTGLDMHCHAKI